MLKGVWEEELFLPVVFLQNDLLIFINGVNKIQKHILHTFNKKIVLKVAFPGSNSGTSWGGEVISAHS